MKYVTIAGSKGYAKRIIVATGQELREGVYSEDMISHCIKLGPYGDLYIVSHLDWEDIARMADLETYDFALPQSWFDAHKDELGFFDAKYVWCYDGPEYRLSGHAVALSQLLLTVVLPKIMLELTKGNEE